MIKNCLLLILLATPMSLSAKEFMLQVSISSDHSAPVMLYGTVTGNDDSPDTHEFSCSAHLTLANVSGKSILMVATEVRAMINANGVIRSQLDERDVNDYFLKSDVFVPNSSMVLETKLFPQSAPAKKFRSMHSRKVTADAKVIFVQFADGSTWGDLATGREFLEQRQQAWKELRLLADLYHSNDEQKFVTALSEPAVRGPYLGKLALVYAQTKSIDPVVRELENLLRLGSLHLRDTDKGNNSAAGTSDSEGPH